MPIQASTAVGVDAPITIGDHNTLVVDVAALMSAVNVRRLDSPINPAAGAPLLLDLRPKAAAFTFGTAPVTSAGYFRHPDGSPWSADSIQGLPMDRPAVGFTALNATTVNTLHGERLYLLPPHVALTVSKIEALIPTVIGVLSGGGFGYLDKVELLVVKIAADGAETQLGPTASEATSVSSNSSYRQDHRWISAGLGGTFAVEATERLGIRVKWYGHHGTGGANTCQLFPLANFNADAFYSSADSPGVWHEAPVRFAVYLA